VCASGKDDRSRERWGIQRQRKEQHRASALTAERRPFDLQRATERNDVARELSVVHRRATTWIICAAMAAEIRDNQAIVGAEAGELVCPKITSYRKTMEQQERWAVRPAMLCVVHLHVVDHDKGHGVSLPRAARSCQRAL
jgi:hypothetical protein